MRVLFASTRGSGHFRPLVPLIEACRRGGHEILVIGPPPLEPAVRDAGYPFRAGAAPPDDEMGRLWSRVPDLSYEEAERLVIGGIFATLNVRAMLPAMRAAVRDWRPDVLVREPAELASAVVADEAGLPHVQVAIMLSSSYAGMNAMAADAVDAWSPGLVDRIRETPYLTPFPASLEDPAVDAPPLVHRFRQDAAEPPGSALPDWWPGDRRPLVYVTFGSETAGVPSAAPIYDVALQAVAEIGARVLMTTGDVPDGRPPAAPGPHVHVTRWVPQAEVLAHARAVVCHGGSGTVLGALAAGVPLVVTPLFADQPENGRRVAAVGAGTVVEPREPAAMRSAIDPATLRAAIDAVLADDAFTRAAARIATEIRELPPADTVLGVLDAAVAG